LVVWLITASVALSLCALLPGSTVAASSKTITVRVEELDFAFALSRKSVPAGSTVRFVVRNHGSTMHDFVVRSRRTRLLKPGESQTITVSFKRKGTFRFLCSVPGHAKLGMKGAFGVARKPPAPTPDPPAIDTSDLATLTRVGTFERPVLVTAPPGDARRIFVVEQTGAVRIVKDGELLPDTFLDLRGEVKLSSEPGLLSIAFAPDYGVSGRLYVFYNSTAGNGDIRISEFRRHPTDPNLADPYSERILLTIPKPWENHNGGMLQFGPDGFLYASIGDGDSGIFNPPGHFAQRRDDLLGNILRIDPRTGDPYAIPEDNPYVDLDGVRPEIWAYGLRNPWRFWIDHATESMFIGDAGSPHAGARWPIPVRRLLLREDHCARGRKRAGEDIGRSRARRSRVDELRRRRRAAYLRHVAQRRRLSTRPEARDLSSAAQAAARSPSQIGVRST